MLSTRQPEPYRVRWHPLSADCTTHLSWIDSRAAAATAAAQEAKRAWLAKLDAPSWGQAAAALSSVVAEATQMAAAVADCDSGVDVACEELSNEDEAKKAWLTTLDVPAWGAAAATVTQVAQVVKVKVPVVVTDGGFVIG